MCKQLVVGPRGIFGAQSIADGIVLPDEQRMHHAQANPPVSIHAGIVNSAAVERKQSVLANAHLSVLSGTQPHLGAEIVAIDLRAIPPMRRRIDVAWGSGAVILRPCFINVRPGNLHGPVGPWIIRCERNLVRVLLLVFSMTEPVM